MRHLGYFWRLVPYAEQNVNPANPVGQKVEFSLYNFPEAGEPFSLFTSQYGSAGKYRTKGLFQYAGPTEAEPYSLWDRKQIASLPLVREDQFVVIDNFGSSPGVLPIPTVTTLNRYWQLTFTLQARATFTNRLFIWDWEYQGAQNPAYSLSNRAQGERLLELGGVYAAMVQLDVDNINPGPDTPYYFVISNATDVQNFFEVLFKQSGIGEAFGDMVTVKVVESFAPPGFIDYVVTSNFVRFGVNQNPPSFSIQTSASKSDRRKTIDATVIPSTALNPLQTADYYENVVPNGFLQLEVNDTGYFSDPIHVRGIGISGDAAPFPQEVGFKVPQWSLKPNCYILPGQTWDLQYTVMNDMAGLQEYIDEKYTGATEDNYGVIGSYWVFAEAFASYYLFEGAEAMICHQLLKLGITVNPDSVLWYKKQILEMEGLDPKTFEVYLDLQRKWRDKQKRLDEHYARGRKK